MNALHRPRPVAERRAGLLTRLRQAVPAIASRAPALDEAGAFPAEDIDALQRIGLLAAPLPEALGGLGMGTEPDGAADLLAVFRALGRANLSVGRLFEGHVNALRLVVRTGTGAQARQLAADALAGALFGVWNTDDPAAPLRLGPNLTLCGAKAFCSGAGDVDRALVTVPATNGPQLLLLALAPGERADLSGWTALGMRASRSGAMRLDGFAVTPDSLIGAPGDYLRRPDFAAGAWRTSAVTLGGLEAMVAAASAQLVERGRADDPQQRARIGQVLIAQETAALWLWRASALAEAEPDPYAAEDVVAYVGLARLAVERAALDAMQLVQRSLGLPGLLPPNPVERIGRDLTIYLRQPVPDRVLHEAVGHFLARPMRGW